jgi:hypothetical protein
MYKIKTKSQTYLKIFVLYCTYLDKLSVYRCARLITYLPESGILNEIIIRNDKINFAHTIPSLLPVLTTLYQYGVPGRYCVDLKV